MGAGGAVGDCGEDGGLPGWSATRVAGAGAVTPAGERAGADSGAGGAPGAPAPARGGLSVQAALYARVSTSKQEQEETIASQLAALREAAGERGVAVPAEREFIDDGYSGAKLERPALERLRDQAAAGELDLLLVAAPDRLARQYAYQVVVLEELAQAGVAVVFLNHAFGQSPAEQMLLQMQGVFAEYERALITERTRRGRLFAARAGRVNWGQAPYGYRLLPKTAVAPQQLLVDEAEAEVVRQVYHWLVAEGLASYAIARRLTAQGVPTRTGRAAGWAQSVVIEILRDPMYKGEAFYNRHGPADAKRPRLTQGLKDRRPGNQRGRALRPAAEWIPVPVPALIDPETWEQAQTQLARNRERSSRNNTQHPYLLRSLLVCGRCGRRLAGATRWGTRAYECSARYPRTAPGACDGAVVRADVVEPLVWAYVRDLLADPALLRARYQEGADDPAQDAQAAQELARLDRHLQTLTREEQRLLDAYQAGVLALPELAERRQQITARGQHLHQRRQDLARQQRDREQELRLLAGADTFCQSIQTALDAPSFQTQQQVLQLVVDRVVVDDAQFIVHHVVPTAPFRLQTDHATEAKATFVG